jgi:Predicted ATP-dependent serine protease
VAELFLDQLCYWEAILELVNQLLLQLAITENLKVLYISGEESDKQIRMRADRLGLKNERCYLLTETNLNSILTYATDIRP